MACFSCGESLSGDVRALLQKHKDRYDKYGVKIVYFITETNGQIQIADAKDFFRTIKKHVFTKKAIAKGAEFALIQEFGQVVNSNILGNIKK
jgi:hypothetical protein